MANNTKSKKTEGKKKGKLVLSLAVLLLSSALFLNWYFTNNDVKQTLTPLLSGELTTKETKNLGEASFVGATTKPTETPKNESEYFSTARLERQKARDSALEELQKIANNETGDSAAKKVATEKVTKLTDSITAENKIETLVKAKEVDNCLAIISDNKVEVIVKIGELSDPLVIQIKEIVMNQTKISYENISIIESK